MRRIVLIVSLLGALCVSSIFAQSTKGKVFLNCNALTTSYTYTRLYGDLAGCLTQAGFVLVHSADEANWTIQVYGSTGKQQEMTYGATTWYFTTVTASIMIDRGAFASRVFETNLTVKGSHNTDFDDAALDAYRRLTPQICETIMQQIAP